MHFSLQPLKLFSIDLICAPLERGEFPVFILTICNFQGNVLQNIDVENYLVFYSKSHSV